MLGSFFPTMCPTQCEALGISCQHNPGACPKEASLYRRSQTNFKNNNNPLQPQRLKQKYFQETRELRESNNLNLVMFALYPENEEANDVWKVIVGREAKAQKDMVI